MQNILQELVAYSICYGIRHEDRVEIDDRQPGISHIQAHTFCGIVCRPERVAWDGLPTMSDSVDLQFYDLRLVELLVNGQTYHITTEIAFEA